MLASTGTSSNAFLFAGEQLDPNLGHYYLRARYMDPANGRFTQMDLFSGYDTDPVSLHKYLYANGNLASYRDPSGYVTLNEQAAASRIRTTLAGIQLDSGAIMIEGAIMRGQLTGWGVLLSMVPYGAATRWVVRGVKEIRVGRGVVRYSGKAPPEAKELSAAAIIADKFDERIFPRGTGLKGLMR